MKLIFISQDPKVKELIETLSYDNVNMLSDASLLDDSKYDENLTLLFLDYDNDKDTLEELNKSLVERSDVIRIVISETLSVQELKDHQNSAESAHGYIRKPLTDEIVMGVIEDFEFSEGLEFVDDEEESATSDATGEILVAVDEESSEDMNLELSDDIADKASDEDSSGLSFNIPEGSDDSDDISLDLDSSDDLDLSASVEVAQGIDLSLSDDSGELELSNGDDDSLDLDTGSDEIEGGIELGDDSVGSLELSDGSDDELNLDTQDAEVEGGIDLGNDTAGALELSDGNDDGLDLDSQSEEIEGGIDLGDGTSGELELSDGNDDSDSLEAQDAEIEGGIDLGTDTGGALELSDGNDDVEMSQETAPQEGDLSLSGVDAGELEMDGQKSDDSDLTPEEDLLDFTKDDENSEAIVEEKVGEDSAINLDMVSEDTKEDAGTVEFQFSKPESEKEQTKSENDVSLAFNLQEESESTSTDAQAADFSIDEIEASAESSGETNPTIVIGSDATAQLREPNLETESIQVSPVELPNEETKTTADQAGLNYTATVKEDDIVRPNDEHLIKNYAEDEMIRLQATIRQLREEREDLLEKIDGLETHSQLAQQDQLGQKAEVEELKIEVNILKKRHQNELEEAKYQLRLSDEKKQILEEKSKNYQKEFERLSQKVRIDFNKVKQREKELESQLEMLAIDSESQVKTRDVKILELKRKIDSLEFNMENVSIKEQKHREDKVRLEDKMAKMMKTLRGSIEVLENDVEEDISLVDQQEDEI